jgi:glycosyltransferase involved in cell wall biosynthesis
VVRNLRRLTLIGPVPPLRGGIAHHTESLRSALAGRVDLQTVAYRRMYPRLLFPGRTQYEPGMAQIPLSDPQRRVSYALDALAPRTWHAALRAVRTHGSDHVIMPWWTAALALPTWYLARGCRSAGARVTLLCHNVIDHESAPWKRAAAAAVFGQCDRFVAASEEEAARLRTLRPGAVVHVHPHPVYRFLPEPDTVPPRRAARELLFFGLVRPYKGLDVLIDALIAMPDTDWQLTVAGEPWQDLTDMRDRLRRAGAASRVEWIDRYVPAPIAAELFARADVVVLPYLHATGCGVLALTLGAGKPVIASSVPGLREQVVDGETGWLVPPGDAQALAAAIAAVSGPISAATRPAVRTLARRWSWDSLAEALLDE